MPGSDDAVVQEYPDSVASGLSLDEIAADPERVWQSNRAEKTASFKDKGLRRGGEGDGQGRFPRKGRRPRKRRPPCCLSRRLSHHQRRPQGRDAAQDRARARHAGRRQPAGWSGSTRSNDDGDVRSARSCDGEARLITRHGKDWTDRFAPIARAAEQLPVSEAILVRRRGRSRAGRHHQFSRSLQNVSWPRTGRATSSTSPSTSLYLDGYDSARALLLARKQALLDLLRRRRADPPGRPRRGGRRGVLPAGLQVRSGGSRLQH